MEIYKGWEIKQCDYIKNYYEAINTKDCDCEIIYSKKIEYLKKEIDDYLLELTPVDYLNKLSIEIHKNNKEKGFYENKKNIGEILCLIHSEISEALEADRKAHKTKLIDVHKANGFKEDFRFQTYFNKNIKDTFQDEIADVLIRTLDLCGYKNIDIDAHVKAKLRYNKLRKYKHGKKY